MTRQLIITAVLTLAVVASAGEGPARPPAKKRPPNPAFAAIQDVAGLPRVLIIGDSISIGYTLATRELLKDKANVHRIPTNAGPTSNGVKNLQGWLGDGPWDVIHVNFGLHDLKRMEDGKHQVPLDQYAANLRQIVQQLKQTGATIIWASTTPVPQGELKPPRSDEDVVAYNRVALEIMQANGVQINDLYAFALPQLAQIQLPVNVHFTPEGSKVLAGKVAEAIGAALAGK